jgi:uncharacterized OB-fold protein
MSEQRDFTGASFYEYLAEGKLMAVRCLECASLYVPPRPFCPQCRTGKALVWTELSGDGKLTAFTVIAIAPTFMVEQGYGRENPYCTGIVGLDEGPMVSARIVGVDSSAPDGIKIGARMRLSILPAEGDRRPVLAFEPA